MKKIALTLLLAAVTSAASATVFTNRTDFNNATAISTTVDFEGIASAGGYTYFDNTYSSNGITFSTGQYFVVSSTYDIGEFSTGTGDVLFENSYNGTTMSVDLGGTYSAFAVDLKGFLYQDNALTITLSDGETFNLLSKNDVQFFGVTTNAPITALTIQSTYYTSLDNVSVGNATNNVPEPTSIALLGLGLLGFAAARRKSAK